MDIGTFLRIEEIMENFTLYHLMKENDNDELFDLESAKKYYAGLEKEN
jgi:hypothetical protein